MGPRLLLLLLCMTPATLLMAQTPSGGNVPGTSTTQKIDRTAMPAEIDRATPAKATLGAERMNQSPVATSVQADSAFVAKAGKAGATEVSAAQLALSKSKDERVRQFADHMIRDHSKLTQKLNAVTRSEKMENPPADPDEELMSLLRSLDGDAFDQAYIQHVAIEGHSRALEAFTDEAQSGGSPGLRKIAREALPVIRKHLEMAKQLDKR